jgi:putative SOS response-associated peptidase YedK
MWKDAFRRTRCLLPGTSWTEWQKAHGVKIPHRLQRHDGRGFMFAGLWSLWRARPGAEPMATCAVLTMPASPGLLHVHDRMPVVLAPAAWTAWLDPGATEPGAALALLQRHAVAAVTAVTIDRH